MRTNMRRLILLLVGVCAPLACHAQTFVNTASATALPLTVPSTGAGNNIYVVVDGTGVPGGISVGSQAATQVGSTFVGPAGSYISVWVVASSTSGSTAVSCTGCPPSVYAAYEYEYAGMNTSSPFDTFASCTSTSANCTASYTPGTANEAVLTASSCGGNASGVTGTNITWQHVTHPSGEAGATGTTSSVTTIGAAAVGCSYSGTLIFGFKAAGAAATPTMPPAVY